MVVEVSIDGPRIRVEIGVAPRPAEIAPLAQATMSSDGAALEEDARAVPCCVRIEGLDERVLRALLVPPEVNYALDNLRVSWVDTVDRRCEAARTSFGMGPSATNCSEMALCLFVTAPGPLKPLLPPSPWWQASDVMRHALAIRAALESHQVRQPR